MNFRRSSSCSQQGARLNLDEITLERVIKATWHFLAALSILHNYAIRVKHQALRNYHLSRSRLTHPAPVPLFKEYKLLLLSHLLFAESSASRLVHDVHLVSNRTLQMRWKLALILLQIGDLDLRRVHHNVLVRLLRSAWRVHKFLFVPSTCCCLKRTLLLILVFILLLPQK